MGLVSLSARSNDLKTGADENAGWFIQNIQDYTKMCPNGLSILDDKVKRRFPADDTWVPWDHARAFEYESSVMQLVQEILQRHAEGIEFREYNVSLKLVSGSTHSVVC